MGQTLTHGIYLPDEGERNCYSGLAGNWQLLDGSVGTIAAHTAALAGKAPLVHTHTKADITDFPAYGNAAGTICEGNDSRLSDARTPVAHTHTKSDVTDLLNSNFIPSANNSYDLGSSSYQWKTLNGINPGALSLPTTDISKLAYFNSDITDLTGGLNTKTFALDGWITIIIPNVSGDSIAIDNSIGQVVSISAPGTGDPSIAAICPVRAGISNKIYVRCSGGSIVAAYTWCQGNV